MDNSWFNTKELTDSVFMIQEPLRRLAPDYLTNTINMFVIFDKKEALLIDCGTGIYSISVLVSEILGPKTIQTPFITHSDWDHIGSLYEFETALMHEADSENVRIEENLDQIRLDVVDRNDQVLKDLPNPFVRKIFDGESMHVKNGEWIQVGKLELQILYLPGHTKGSIGLWYPDEKFLFVGDAFQTGYVYADKNPKEYFKTLEKLQEFKLGTYFMPGHEKILLQGTDLDELIEIFKKIENGSLESVPLKNTYLDNHFVQGDKFSVILPNLLTE